MKESIIKLNGISKSYDKKLILDKIDLSVEENQSIAITGNNGRGKSTLLKIIAGVVCPSEGSVSYSRKLLFHYVPERFPKMKFTVGQYLQRICEIDGISPGMAKDRIESLCDDFFSKGHAAYATALSVERIPAKGWGDSGFGNKACCASA